MRTIVGDSCHQRIEERSSRNSIRLLDQLDEGEFRGAIHGDIQVELAFLGSDLSDIDVEEADRVALELPSRRLVTLDFAQT